ncbi:MAG: patatin-like phospholipase family protein [Chthoniobacterales bacterium]
MDATAQLRHSREGLLLEVLRQELGHLDSASLERLLPRVRWTELEAGAILFREGDAADAMYVVVSGRLRATKRDENQDRTIGEITRGETVGEMALLTGGTRSASVQAMRDCVLAGLDTPTFAELARLSPETVMHVARVQFDRLQRVNHPRKNHVRLSVVILAADPGCDAQIFARKLQIAMDPRAHALLVEPSAAPRGAGSESDRKHRFAFWLNELETQAPVLIMPGAPGDPAWTRQCLHNADLVLMLARSGHRPSVPEDLIPTALRRLLVVMHGDGATAPTGTSKAKQTCAASEHFHYRENSPADLARLVRLLTGRANGIAFAGGGARSFAHLGVLRALKEHGIPLDLTAGTSLGAIVAAGISLDIDLDDLVARFRIMVQVNPTKRDYLLIPRTSLLSGRKLDRLLPRLLPSVDIDDCWKGFSCVSANITNPGAHIHRSGPLIPALRATVSIPGVFPPVILPNGDLLVDGGVVNNLPADVVRDNGAGRIIACDQGTTSGAKKDAPSAIGIIMRSIILHSDISSRIWHTEADLYFDSLVGNITLLEWHHFDLAMQRGYENASRVLENVDPADWQ